MRGLTVQSSFALVLLVAAGFSCPAMASNNNVIALSCASAVHVADFKNCAAIYELHNGVNGLFVAVNPTAALSAFVRASGTWTPSNCGFGGTSCLFGGGTLTPVTAAGTALTTDAQLTAIDRSIFAQMRAANAVSAPIKVPTEYGGSYINNDALAEDTNSAISNVLYVQRLVNPANVPIGTIVTVIWTDGTSAQFIRVSSMGSYQWQYVGGSARNAQGKPINPNGTVVTNPHTTGIGSGTDYPSVTGSGGYNWLLNLEGSGNCTYTTSVTVGGEESIVDVSYAPC